MGRFKNAAKYLEEAEGITRVEELQRIHILGELAIVYQHATPARASEALSAAIAQYGDAKELARKEWQSFADRGLLENKHRALQADAQACRATGNIGLFNYIQSQELTLQSKDSTVRGLSRFFYGYALLKNGKMDMAKERLGFSGPHPDMCTSTIASCKEPLENDPKYLEEITALGLNMEHYDEHGFSALDYAVFQTSFEMRQVVLRRLKEGNYGEAEKDEEKRAATISRLERESVAKRHWRELFQECLRPNLMNGGSNSVQKVRGSYADLLKKDEVKRATFDQLRVVSYSDFIAHRQLPSFTDGITREYSTIRATKGGEATKDCVVFFFSYRWRHDPVGLPDDNRTTEYGQGTQYGRMCEALQLLLDDSDEDNRKGSGHNGESFYVWLDYACINQEIPEPVVQALPIIATQCDVMITLNEPDFFERGWCAVEAALIQTLKQSYKVHKWYEHKPGENGSGDPESALQELSRLVPEYTSDLQVTCEQDKPTIECLLRQSKFLGH